MSTSAPRTASHMQEEAEKWDTTALVSTWKDIKNGVAIPGWASGKAFEYLVIRAFQIEGAVVRWPYNVTYPQKFGTMEQIDGVVYVDNRPFLIESKDMSDAVAIEALAKLRFRLEGRPPFTMAVLFSKSDFSQPVEVFAQFASPLNVLLWSSSDMEVALPASSMMTCLCQKVKYAIEYGLPLFPFDDKDDHP